MDEGNPQTGTVPDHRRVNFPLTLPERRFHYILTWALSGRHIRDMAAPNGSVDCERLIQDMEEGLFEEWSVPKAATTENGEWLESYRAFWGDVELEAGRKFDDYPIPDGATIKIRRELTAPLIAPSPSQPRNRHQWTPAEAAIFATYCDPNTFHKEAREVLEAVIAHGSAVEFDESGAAEHMDLPKDKVMAIPKWPTWKRYIAKHTEMSNIVGGGGIVRVTAVFNCYTSHITTPLHLLKLLEEDPPCEGPRLATTRCQPINQPTPEPLLFQPEVRQLIEEYLYAPEVALITGLSSTTNEWGGPTRTEIRGCWKSLLEYEEDSAWEKDETDHFANYTWQEGWETDSDSDASHDYGGLRRRWRQDSWIWRNHPYGETSWSHGRTDGST